MKRFGTRLIVLVAVLVAVSSAAAYRVGLATPSVGVSQQTASAQ